ncbi:MAG: hypothetical protein WBD63_00785 [Phycisphaerae bacterium]
MTPEPMVNPPRALCRLSFGSRHSFVILFAAFAALGCGCMAGRSGNVYRLRGRVLDAETGRGLDRARLRLRALMPTALGPKTLAAYGLTQPDGTYELELGAGFDVMREALRIRLEAGKPGYDTASADFGAPAGRQTIYPAPDITLRPETPTPFAKP